MFVLEERRRWKQGAWLLCQVEIMKLVVFKTAMDGVSEIKYEVSASLKGEVCRYGAGLPKTNFALILA